MVAIGDGSTGTAWAALALANALTNSTSADAAPPVEPKTLWLQNLAIAIEVLLLVFALVACSLRAYIRIRTKNLGWGTLLGQLV